jgi:uroporphyrinogen decarboxylase
MTHRERYTCAINHRKPDRVPFDLEGTTLTSCHENFMNKMIAFCDINADTHEEAIEKILTRYDIDFRRTGELFEPQSPLLDYSTIKSGRYTDGWGIERTFTGLYWDITGCPFRNATLEELKAYPWPDAAQVDKKRVDAHTRKAKRLYEDSDYVVVAEHPVYGYLELGCWMFGFEDFLYRLVGEQETAEWFFERYHRYVVDVCELYYGSLGKYIHLTTSGMILARREPPFCLRICFAAPLYRGTRNASPTSKTFVMCSIFIIPVGQFIV